MMVTGAGVASKNTTPSVANLGSSSELTKASNFGATGLGAATGIGAVFLWLSIAIAVVESIRLSMLLLPSAMETISGEICSAASDARPRDR